MPASLKLWAAAAFAGRDRAAFLWLVFWLIAAVGLRLAVIFVLPATTDEIKLAEETLNFHWYPLPVQFLGYGWGENIFLAVLAKPFITWFGWPLLLTLRGVVLVLNIAFIFLLFSLARRLFGRLTAAVVVAFAAVWPWSILAGSVAFNAFAIPVLWTLALRAWVAYNDRQRPFMLCVVTAALALSLYAHSLSFIWVPSLVLLLVALHFKRIRWAHAAAALSLFLLLAAPITLFYVSSQLHWWSGHQFLFFSYPVLSSNRIAFLLITGLYHGWALAGHYLLNYFLHFVYLFLSYTPLGGIGFYFLNVFFGPRFIFLTPEYGLFFMPLAFIWDVILVPIGIYQLARRRNASPHYRWLLVWLLIYPLGPSLINADYVGFTPTRDIAGLPLLLLLSAVGASSIIRAVGRLVGGHRKASA